MNGSEYFDWRGWVECAGSSCQQPLNWKKRTAAVQLSTMATVGETLQLSFCHPVVEDALQSALYDLYGKVDAKYATLDYRAGTPVIGIIPFD
jgi:hypothetical protein